MWGGSDHPVPESESFSLLLFVRPQKDKYKEEDMGHVMSDISEYYNIRLVEGFCVGNLNDSLGGH